MNFHHRLSLWKIKDRRIRLIEIKMRLKVLTVLMSCFICKPLNYQIEGRDTTASDLDFFRPINVNEMQANWDQATFRLIPFPSTGSSLFLLVDPSLFKLFFLLFKIVFRN